MAKIVDFHGNVEQFKIFLSDLAIKQCFLFIDSFNHVYTDNGIIVEAKVAITGP